MGMKGSKLWVIGLTLGMLGLLNSCDVNDLVLNDVKFSEAIELTNDVIDEQIDNANSSDGALMAAAARYVSILGYQEVDDLSTIDIENFSENSTAYRTSVSFPYSIDIGSLTSLASLQMAPILAYIGTNDRLNSYIDSQTSKENPLGTSGVFTLDLLPDEAITDSTDLTGLNFKTTGVNADYEDIEYIYVPPCVGEIGSDTFNSTANLKAVVLSSSVQIIEASAFANKSNLVDVDIKNTSMQILNDQIFANCTSLAYLVLPSSLGTISSSTFSGCTSLASLYFEGSKDDWTNNVTKETGWADDISATVIHCSDGNVVLE